MTKVFHGHFFVENEFKDRYVEVEDGIIKSVKSETSETDIERVDGKIIPAGVDIHVHFRDPGEEQKEDFRSGSISALFGGTTFVADMPNNKKPILTSEDFRNKISSISGKSYVDYALYQAASYEIIDEAIGEKIFLGKSTGGILSDIRNSKFSDKVKVVHAELQECLDRYKGESRNLQEHDKARPLECEIAAIEEMFKSNIRNVHIAHLTSVRSLNIAKNFGFTTEVTPHHLLLNSSSDLYSYGKVNPPLRSKAVQEELLNSIGSKMIDMVSSDHAPHTYDEKSDFMQSPSGVPGVETRFPIILYLSRLGLISLERAITLASINPAKRIGINKGFISEGFDADFVSIDFRDEKIIKGDDLHSKAKWTPFEGFKGIFPKKVYLRGNILIDDNDLTSGPLGVLINGKQQRKEDY